MDIQEQKRLLEKFYTNRDQLSLQELKKLFLWLNSERGTLEMEHMLDHHWQEYGEGSDGLINTSKILQEIRARIHRNKVNSPVRKKIIHWIPYAAAILLAGLIYAGLQFYTLQPRLSRDVSLLYEYEGLTQKPKRVILPDGSKVVLFPGSKLVIPDGFKKSPVRNARLEGEAFFEIARNEKQPFVLETGGIGLEVLGTSFNVSSYPDDIAVEVALQSGQVKLFEGNRASHAEEFILDPGHLARYVRGEDGFTIEKTDVKQYTSWVDGMLIFRDDPMKEVFRRLERWYGVKIEVLDPSVNEFIYTAKIRNESLEQILKLIEYTSPVNFRIVRDQSVTKVFIQKNKKPV